MEKRKVERLSRRLNFDQIQFLFQFNDGNYPLPDILKKERDEIEAWGLVGSDGEGDEWCTELGLAVEKVLRSPKQ
jgi:hypothetical protein